MTDKLYKRRNAACEDFKRQISRLQTFLGQYETSSDVTAEDCDALEGFTAQLKVIADENDL